MSTVRVLRRAQAAIERVPDPTQQRVRAAISDLARDPRPPGCVKLKGREGWRIRVGDYRVLYTIDDQAQIVTVFDMGNRREIYR